MNIRLFTNIRSAFALLALALALALSAELSWAKSSPELTLLQTSDADSDDYTERLDAENALIRHRIAVKERVVTAILEQRMTLEAATKEFMQLDRELPARSIPTLTRAEGETALEVNAKYVIRYTATHEDNVPRREKLVQRLEEELQTIRAAEHSNCDGND